jgi:Ricin-type beta-trefoil lectin domain/Lysozyme like domain
MRRLHGLYRLRWFHIRFSLVAKIAIPLAITGLAIGLPAYAASTDAAASDGQSAHMAASGPTGNRPPLIAPLAVPAPRSAATVASASATCAQYAARAGWANNGYFAGDLVTATAVCIAESAGDPKVYVCDQNGKVVGQGEYVRGQPIKCPVGTTSYDRGLWQLNSQTAASTTDQCAFDPVCNAKVSYLASSRGTSFIPWSSYDQNTYAKYIDAAQRAVTRLTIGAVTSAELGECLQAKSVSGAKVVIANCGSGGAIQRWTVAGGKLRSGSLCAAISSTSAASPGIVLRRCASQKTQQWTVAGRYELRNAASGKCLTDPNSSLTAGTQVTATGCVNAKNQTWWLP